MQDYIHLAKEDYSESQNERQHQDSDLIDLYNLNLGSSGQGYKMHDEMESEEDFHGSDHNPRLDLEL